MIAPFYARTTTRLSDMQADTGLALGGAAGARRLSRQGLPVSRNKYRCTMIFIRSGAEPNIFGVNAQPSVRKI